ncbi:MAG: 3-phytase [Gammaproteobacteria bacterium]|nr:MAG: 3-phytase [Gammaproteobacteria bacterium]
MKIFLIFSLVIILIGNAVEGEVGIFLPEVVVIPENSTFSVKLRQVENDEFIVEPDSMTAIKSSITNYNLDTKSLYIPSISIGDQHYNQVQLELVTPITNPFRFRLVSMEIDKNILKNVSATLETKPVRVSGDAADDPAIWIHPIDPSQSLIIGTQKKGGLAVYDLAGQEIQYLPHGHFNNVDLRYYFPLQDKKFAIVAASNRTNDSIAIYKVNPVTGSLEDIAAHTLFVGLKDITYGLCMYHSLSSDKYYVFINDKGGAVEQWEIFDNGNGLVDASLVRRFRVDSIVEGCVADDVLGHFYLGEEKVGIWKFNAEPDGGNKGYLIDTTRKGNLTPEVEGLTIYYLSETEGYLIASNQGNNTFTVYNRTGDNEYLGKFRIIANKVLGIDAVEETDGIDVINMPLGEAFPYGVFIVQDGKNVDPVENQNFKLVPWEKIADALGLKKESSYHPRGKGQR